MFRLRELIVVSLVGMWAVASACAIEDGGVTYEQYWKAARAHRWQQQQEVHLTNPEAEPVDVAVTVPLGKEAMAGYCALDPQGRPVPTQLDDLNNDGRVDRISFIATIPGKGNCVYRLLGSRQPLAEMTPAFSVSPKELGSWVPKRFQPALSQGLGGGAAQYSEYNQEKVQQLIENGSPVSAPFHVTIGDESGLIEALYPATMRGFDGSYFREYVPNRSAKGKLTVVACGPVRVVLRYEGQPSRIFVLYRNGRLETYWSYYPQYIQLISGAHPYQYMATSPDDVVRYTQLTDRRRQLRQFNRCALFGYQRSSLSIAFDGLSAIDEQMWPDPGEIMFEAGLRAQKQQNTTNPDVRQWTWPIMQEWCPNYLAGGYLRLLTFMGKRSPGKLIYHIGQQGEAVLNQFNGQQPSVQIGPPQTIEQAKLRIAEPPQPVVSVEAPHRQRDAMLIYPNEFNGWKLRPLKLMQENPHPAFFPLKIVNPTSQPVEVSFWLDHKPWMREATIQYNPTEYPAGVRNMTAIDFADSGALGNGRSVQISVPAGGSTTASLRIWPTEHSLGNNKFVLRWAAGSQSSSLPLTVTVRPDQFFHYMWVAYGVSPENDHVRWSFTNVETMAGPFYHTSWHGASEQLNRCILAQWRDLYRKGYSIWEYYDLRTYISYQATHESLGSANRNKFFSPPPEQWVEQVAQLQQHTSELDRYRSRYYLADEIWEILGGYKGRRYMPLDKAAKLFEDVLMNCKNPAFNSFMIHGADDNYDAIIPNDIPQVFCYTGSDKIVHGYANNMLRNRRQLVSEWLQDPDLRQQVKGEEPRILRSFWISARLHQTNYPTVRHMLWWLRDHGFDIPAIWAAGSWNIVYAGSIGDWSLMATRATDGLMVTDRALAVLDSRQDWSLMTLAMLLRDRATGTDQAAANALIRQAFDCAEHNDFDKARHLLVQVVKRLAPQLIELCPPDYYTPIQTTPLPQIAGPRPAAEQAALEIPEITLSQRLNDDQVNAPIIDGKLDEAYQKNGIKLSEYWLLSGAGHPQAPTITHIGYDQSGLYVHCCCMENKMGQIKTAVKQRDGPLWNDDAIELFILPQEEGKAFFQFVINAAGVRFDSRRIPKPINVGDKTFTVVEVDADWNPDYQVATQRSADRWQVEVFFPWEMLGGPPQKGATWRANFCRDRAAVPEISSWSFTSGSFHNSDRFGRVHFGA